MKKIIPKSLVIISMVLLLFSGCNKKGSKGSGKSYPITIAIAEEKDAPIYVETIGTLTSLQSIDIRPQVTGILLEAHFKRGQYVNKGDLLFTIDPRPYKAALDQAKGALQKDEASLKLSEITVKRYETLVEKDYVSKLNFDQYTTNVKLNEAQLLIDKAQMEQAQINLDFSTILAPISGRVSDYAIDPGNLVVANGTTPLTTIKIIDPADVTFSIPQKDFIKVQQAAKQGALQFLVILPFDEAKPRQGMVYFIDNTLNPANGTLQMRGSIPNSDELLWPGEFVRIKLQTGLIKNGIIVPDEAIKIGQNGYYTFVYNPDEETVAYRPVEIGERIEGHTVVTKGLKKGEQVVTQGQLNLKDGTSVYLNK